jgi:hypothetical protein
MGVLTVLKGLKMTKSEQEAVDWGIAQYTGRKVGSKDNCTKMKVLVDMAIKSDLIVYNINDKKEEKK